MLRFPFLFIRVSGYSLIPLLILITPAISALFRLRGRAIPDETGRYLGRNALLTLIRSQVIYPAELGTKPYFLGWSRTPQSDS